MNTYTRLIAVALAVLIVAPLGTQAGTSWITYSSISASAGQWRYYTFSIPSDVATVTLQTSGGSGDCDVYINYTVNPTLSSFRRRSMAVGNTESITMTAPPAGTLCIGLYAYNAFSGVSLVITRVSGPALPPADWKTDMLNRVNYERNLRGIASLRSAWKLNQSAQKFADEMATYSHTGGSDGHTGRDGSSPFVRINREGYTSYPMGENAACGQGTVAQAMTTWMNSSGHRANILNTGYKALGTGYARNLFDTTTYMTRWVQDFGGY
jgi:hypothetical protein